MSVDGVASIIAHRLNLAALDAIKDIQWQHLRTTEAVTQQLWHFLAASSLHAAILAQIHCLNEDEQVQLKRLVPTRWLSCYESVTATTNELTSIWIALNQILIERRYSSAKGSLYQTMKKKFIMSLNLFKNVLYHIKRLALVFQQGALVYSQILSAIESCKKNFEGLEITKQQLKK
ncbi:MAG: hypothetical protein EZS28_026092 [Streblomastix strix]|uniref:Uncharacterized protein n=1 Tax=Streblomastix strix TaxID=222440 RepID=A0A5J4V7W3_9EUKA|nr:MAG: hypothetical protein EZS28_026092 [Streblomastix strix]